MDNWCHYVYQQWTIYDEVNHSGTDSNPIWTGATSNDRIRVSKDFVGTVTWRGSNGKTYTEVVNEATLRLRHVGEQRQALVDRLGNFQVL